MMEVSREDLVLLVSLVATCVSVVGAVIASFQAKEARNQTNEARRANRIAGDNHRLALQQNRKRIYDVYAALLASPATTSRASDSELIRARVEARDADWLFPDDLLKFFRGIESDYAELLCIQSQMENPSLPQEKRHSLIDSATELRRRMYNLLRVELKERLRPYLLFDSLGLED